MELENIKTQTTWNEAAESINSNNLKIITEVTKLQGATYKNKGYFKTLSDLQSAFPTAAVGSKAYVGLSYPYAIYLWENNSWVDSGATGGEEAVKLDQFYTKEETDTKLTELSERIDDLPQGDEPAYDDTELRNELNKKVNKTDMATINGKSLTEGGNIVIEGGGISVTPDWNASEREAGYIQNKIGGDVHLNSLKGVSYITLEDGSRAYRTYGEVYYSKCKDNNSGGYRWYRLSYTERFEYLQDACYGTREWGSENGYQYRFPTADEINDNYMLEGTIIFYIDPENTTGYDYIEDIVYWGYNEAGVENPIPEWFISDEIARQESVDELREETTALWENLDHGTFPDLVAGDLAGRGESVPASFGFRASGGKSIKDGRAYIKRIKGNSVVWNQMFEPNASSDRSYEANGVHIVDNRDGSYTIWTDEGGATQTTTRGISATHNLNFAGHKLLVVGIKGAFDGFGLNDIYSNSFLTAFNNNAIVTTKNSGYVTFSIYVAAGMVIQRTTWNPRVIDLTQMFQAGNEPTTFEEYEARKPIVEDEYAYNEGQVIHCNTESIKSVGDNAWDEQWEVGSIYTTTGADKPSTSTIRTKNPIKILPNTEYFKFCGNTNASFYWHIYYDSEMNFIETKGVGYNMKFITPINAHYMKTFAEDAYGTTYKNDITISLYHSGWKAEVDNAYKPYWQDTLPLPIIRKYFPDGMKLADTAYDEIRFNKATNKLEAVQRIGSVDMGTLTWKYYENLGGFGGTSADFKPKEQFKAICAKYPYQGSYSLTKDKELGFLYYTNAFIKDSAYTDAAVLKADLQGVMLYYELAEPIVTEITEDFRDYYQVADFGTEMSQSSVPSAAFSADIIYQFNAVDMIREHEMEINELQGIIATMQAQLTSLINK